MAGKILSAGVIVVRRHHNQYKYLILRAYNYWDFPKGMVEPGETPLEAARREVWEETTLADLDFRWGERYRETRPYNHGRKVARYYIAVTRTREVSLPVNPLLGRPEHSEYRWVSRDEAWELFTPRVRAILEWSDGILGQHDSKTTEHDRYKRSKPVPRG
ncbi:MAG: NUDIX domain-containing protein [Candidatus Competibacteraceae bacterium]|nr:NUDIX domain-containing protein [Candidatus Competibacteraceae bacterium]